VSPSTSHQQQHMTLTLVPTAAAAAPPAAAPAAEGRAGVLVVVYNPLAWPRHEVVRVPVSPLAPGKSYSVEGEHTPYTASACVIWLTTAR
jgi:hypothetical protein